MSESKPADPAKLREPFPAHQISKLPKPTKAQTDEVRANFKAGVRCEVCGSWHHPKVVHLDYVGHAALTDRLLDTDINWYWEPMALRDGLPAFDQFGGLWIRLTVAGVTRLGYGNAAAKSGGDPGNREKEVIGDALRNAAMRFGAALDLWHKGDLHSEDDTTATAPESAEAQHAADQQRPRTDDRGVKRLSSAEAKRIGLHTEIEGKLDRCESLLALDLFESAFDTITAQCPLSWLDALRNRIILRREELTSTTGQEDADMDEAFRATMAG